MSFTTVQDWVDDCRDMLLSGHVEERDVLTVELTAGAGSFTVQYGTPGLVPGATVEIDSELMYIHAVSSTTVTVARGYGGSSAAAHSNGALLRVNPKFATYRIINALNADLRDLSSPLNGLYQMKTDTFTYQPNISGYDLANVTDLIDVWNVTWDDPTVFEAEPQVDSWVLRRNRNTSTFSSGFALVLYQGASTGQTVRVMYKAPFTEVSAVTDSLSTTGVPATAYDLPPLGAAMALMSTAPIRREFIDEQWSSRRSDEVPPGAISASMRDLRARRADRIGAEAARLSTAYPDYATRRTPRANKMGTHSYGYAPR
ncbi:MAG: hypothetical protein ACPGT1_08290 [Ilumatobacteraceae bacterium]